jgi:hypothetical protein
MSYANPCTKITGDVATGDRALQKQVAARQADWDLGHVPMLLCTVLLFARSGMPTESRQC